MPHRRTRSQDRMATAAEEVELLAAAQAQAEAEEEIRGRLPREVLNIHRRLDLQQSSVDSLQGDISKLTGIVEQIGLSLQGSRAETPSRSSVTEGNPSFRTPPQPNPNLSPIPEIHTPNSTLTPSSRPPQQHQAVQFGNLARDQLPHPTFPPSPRNSPHLPPTSAAETSRAGATTGSPLFRPISPAHVFSNFPSSQMQSVTSSVPAPMCVSSCTSSLPAATYKSTGWQPDFQHGDTSDYLAPQVFGEMPTPHSLHGTHVIAPGYWNHSYCHHTPIPSSCVQGGSTNLSEQNPDGMPQSYGFHNLHRQSVFLSDGSEHSYFTLPADYPTPLMSHSAVVNVAVEAPPSVAAQVACLTPRLFPKANNTADSESTFIGSRHQAMVVQDASNVFKEMPVYDVYEEDVTASQSCVLPTVDIIEAVNDELEVEVYAGKPIICPEKPTDGVYSFANENKYENEIHTVCFNNVSDNAFSEEATYLTFPHADRSIKLTTENSTQATSTLCVHEAIVYCHDEKPEHINCTNGLEPVQLKFEQEDILISGAVSDVVNSKAWAFGSTPSHCINHVELRLLWDPGDTTFHVLFMTADSATKLQCIDVYKPAVVQILAVQFSTSRAPIFQSAKQDVLINKHDISESKSDVSFLKSDISPRQHPCDLSDDKEEFSNKKLHLFPWIRRSAIIILQQLHNKNISSLLELSLEKRTQVQWDPGIELLLYELLWLKTVKKGTEYALRHLLAMKFGTHDSTYFIDTATTMCSSANLMQQGRNFAAVLRFWLPIFNDMHCCQIFQKCNAISSQLCWYQDIKFNGIPLWLINFQVP